MKRNQAIIILALIILVIVLLWIFAGSGGSTSNRIYVPVKYGTFEIKVTTMGELEAKSSEKIYGPGALRNFRIWQLKIEDIIPDGTVVDSGDYVASLDPTELVNKMKDKELDVETYETQFTKTQLDTTLELRQTRDNLVNLKYSLEEKQIVVDQSIYEPPATQRQAKIELEKAQRTYRQSIENYQVKLEKARADMQEVSANLRKATSEYESMEQLVKDMIIYAPKAGMVIYFRDWDGSKKGIGSTVNMWPEPVVAELPNLREMITKTYVNEIDISKVRVNQQVNIGVDAFPEKEYTGSVMEVANIGEQLPNSNAKVFEVIIEVNEYDSILRPAMTTKNEIITSVTDSVQYIPLECLLTNDSISYVFTPRKKQQVIPGKSNDNEIIILAGLEQIDKVSLVPPEDADSWSTSFLDPEVIEEALKAKQEPKKNGSMVEDSQGMREKWESMSDEEKKKSREKMGSGKHRGGKPPKKK